MCPQAEFCEQFQNHKYRMHLVVDDSMLEIVLALDCTEDYQRAPLIVLVTGYWRDPRKGSLDCRFGRPRGIFQPRSDIYLSVPEPPQHGLDLLFFDSILSRIANKGIPEVCGSKGEERGVRFQNVHDGSIWKATFFSYKDACFVLKPGKKSVDVHCLLWLHGQRSSGRLRFE